MPRDSSRERGGDAYHRLTVLTPGDARAWFQLGGGSKRRRPWDEAARVRRGAALAPLDPSVLHLASPAAISARFEAEAAANGTVRSVLKRAAYTTSHGYMRVERYHDARRFSSASASLRTSGRHAALGLACMNWGWPSHRIKAGGRAEEIAASAWRRQGLLAARRRRRARREEERYRRSMRGGRTRGEIAELVKWGARTPRKNLLATNSPSLRRRAVFG